jgi:restriction system protein
MAQARKVPPFDDLMWPTLSALKDSGGSASNQELLARVVQIMNLSEEIQNTPHGEGPRTELEYRLLWARTHLRKAGAINSSERTVWFITAAGRGLTEPDMKKIVQQIRREYRRHEPESEESTPEITELVQSDERWRDQLLSVLQGMPPDAFERLAQRILRESGFIKMEVKGKSGDGGIEGIGVLRLKLLSFQVFFSASVTKTA